MPHVPRSRFTCALVYCTSSANPPVLQPMCCAKRVNLRPDKIQKVLFTCNEYFGQKFLLGVGRAM